MTAHKVGLPDGAQTEAHGSTNPADCPKWGPLGHNWIVIKGWLPWRTYRVCCGCNYAERAR